LILDVMAGPNAGYTVQPKGSLNVNATDTRVRMNAAHERGMKHVRKTNIADVDASSNKKPTGLVRFNTTADERS
jgi:hypothetical protein